MHDILLRQGFIWCDPQVDSLVLKQIYRGSMHSNYMVLHDLQKVVKK